MSHDEPAWIESASKLPLAFAQVREDPLLDREVVEQLGRDVRVLLVASGGCTAALLAATSAVSRLHLVDPNPAQIALSRLKQRLLQTHRPADRLKLLGHTPLPAAERAARLSEELQSLGLAAQSLGPPKIVAELGPDHAGRYEVLFAELRKALGDQVPALAAVLGLDDLAKQSHAVDAATPLGRGLDEALDIVMALPNLVRLFGASATNNPVEPFSRHFARRIRHVLATQTANQNPYLWQMLAGVYPKAAVAPWLASEAPARMPQVTWSVALMADALREADEAFDLVHLSNILDWLSPAEAEETLVLAERALRPGGMVFIRQLNSTLDIPGSGRMFEWFTDRAASLHARDRSFFYRALHVGRKR